MLIFSSVHLLGTSFGLRYGSCVPPRRLVTPWPCIYGRPPPYACFTDGGKYCGHGQARATHAGQAVLGQGEEHGRRSVSSEHHRGGAGESNFPSQLTVVLVLL